MGGVIAMVLTLALTSSPATALNLVNCESGVTCYGTNEDDYIVGTSGDDTIFGKGGDDIILGNAGNDVIHGDGYCYTNGCEGADFIMGGAGDDIIHHDGKMNNHNAQDYKVDQIHCGSGNDTVYYKPTGDNDILLGNNPGCETINTDDS